MKGIFWTRTDERAISPSQAYPGDAGWDLHVLEDTFVSVGVPCDVPTGIAVAIPPGHYGRIVHRSSAPRKKGVMVLEGTIDSGFRGELFALAYVWRGSEWTASPRMMTDSWDLQESGGVLLRAGESIAQLIVQAVPETEMVERDELPDSVRGVKGFGSSGR